LGRVPVYALAKVVMNRRRPRAGSLAMEIDDSLDDTLLPPQFLEVRRDPRGLVITVTERSLFDPLKLDTLQKEFKQAVQNNPSPIYVLNMERVEFISSSFLGMLVSINKKFRAQNAPLRVCAVQSELKRAMTLARLDRLLDLRTDIDDALSPI